MSRLLKPLLMLVLALAVPIVPFLIFGDPLERRIEEMIRGSMPRAAMAGLVVGLLATDIVLPVPSSAVSTVSGRALGFWPGAAASWLGMTLGAVAGFGLARAFGRPLALRLSGADDLDRIDVAAGRFGPLVLVLARPVPVMAEASVLLLGATRLPWGRFLIPAALSNLGIAAAYAALGTCVRLPIAIAASLALPLVAAAATRRFWPGHNGHESTKPS